MVERTGMTAQAFFDLPETEDWLELLDGEIVMSPTPVPLHQRLVANFYTFVIRCANTGWLTHRRLMWKSGRSRMKNSLESACSDRMTLLSPLYLVARKWL